MMAIYPAIYRDAHGEEATEIENDGQTLRMVVRGVEFISKPFGSFDDLRPSIEDEAKLSSFTFDRYRELIEATLKFVVPLPVVVDSDVISATLSVVVDLSEAGTRQEGSRDWADPQMTLILQDQSYASRGGGGSFEGELLQIQRQLPPDAYMKCCFNCGFSGYNPSGDGLWGMFCHRNHKEAYLSATDKSEWFRLNREAVEIVQETYLCSEFQQWSGKTGYRDPLQPYVIKNQ